jgi:hypothetical protein
MINEEFSKNIFFKYNSNKQSVRGLYENPFNKMYEIKERINTNNTKYKNNFIISKFNNILEHNDWTDIQYLNTNINYALGSIATLKKYIESFPDKIKSIIQEYKIITDIIHVNIGNEIKELTNIANKILKEEQTRNILKEIDQTRLGFSVIKECMDKFKIENNPDYSEISELKEIYKNFEYSIINIVNLDFINNYFDIAMSYNFTIFKKVRSMGYVISDADLFLETFEKNNKIKYKEIIKSKYDAMFLFEDNSVLLKNKDFGYTEVSDNQHLNQIQTEIKIDIIRHELRKNPSFLKSMIDVIKRTDTNHNQIFEIIKIYQENKTILKHYDFDIVKSLSSINGNCNYNELEQIDDSIQKLIRKHKIKQFAYSIASKKYHSLYNEETMLIMEHIYDLKINTEIIQNEIGKKMASYKDSVEFNEILYKFYKYFTDMNREKMLVDCKDMNIKIIRADNKIMIMQIENFNQSKHFGSSSWCITREDQYFQKYTQNNKKQYFIYNFEMKLTDKSSLIGITLNDGQLDVAHYKDDTKIKNNDEYLQECIKMINLKKLDIEKNKG